MSMIEGGITLVIPARNEIDCIGSVIDEVPRDVVDEIIVVDGNSTDGTPDLAREKGCTVLTQPGKGYGDAVNHGIKNVKTKYVTMIDADGSYVADDIRKLVAILKEGYDIAYGSRYLPESGSDDDTLIRFIGNKFFTWLMNFLYNVGISDSLFLYVATRKDVFERLNMESPDFEFCIEFPIKAKYAGYTHKEVASFEKARIAGDSKVNAFVHGLKILWVLLKGKFSRKYFKSIEKIKTA